MIFISAAVLILLCALGAAVLISGEHSSERPGFIIIPYGREDNGLGMTVKSAYWEERSLTSGKPRPIILVRTASDADPAPAEELARELTGVYCAELRELAEIIRRDRSTHGS